MSFILESATESTESPQQAAGDSWKTPPPDPGDIPADIPQRVFNEVREEQIAAKKKAGPALFEGEAKKDVSEPIEHYKAAKERDRAAEAQKAQLRSILDRASGERVNGESQSSSEFQPGAKQNGNGTGDYERDFKAAGEKMYGPDFEQTMASGGQTHISRNLEAAIRAIGNPAEIAHIAYVLGKNPEFIEVLEEDRSQLAKISPTVRNKQLFEAHDQRMKSARKADPAAAAAVDAAAHLPLQPAVTTAILEQENSEALIIHFAKNPEILEELNQLPAPAAMSRVGRISAQLEAKAESRRERSGPPPPISPVGSSSTRQHVSLDEMSMRDFMKTRNAQERAYRNRW